MRAGMSTESVALVWFLERDSNCSFARKGTRRRLGMRGWFSQSMRGIMREARIVQMTCPGCNAEIKKAWSLTHRFRCEHCGVQLEKDSSDALKAAGAVELAAIALIAFVSFKAAVVLAVGSVIAGVFTYAAVLRSARITLPIDGDP